MAPDADSSDNAPNLDLFDDVLASQLVAADRPGAAGTGRDALVDELIGVLELGNVLSRAEIGADPIDWCTAGPRAVWRLVEPEAIWCARFTGSPIELFVAQGAAEITLLSPPGARHGNPDGSLLLDGFVSLTRSEPYARADHALSWAMRRMDGPELDPLVTVRPEFDETFRRRPEEALFQAGFSVEKQTSRRYLARLLSVYDLGLGARPVIADGRLVATWSCARSETPRGRPTILLLMSVDDDPTRQLLPHLQRIAEACGYALTPIFALSQWSSAALSPDDVTERLEQAWSEAHGTVAGLVVHYGAAFSTHQTEYRSALSAFQAKHRDVPLASEALLGQRAGELHGVRFDQPSELDFLLEHLGF